jgi:hypothetical protein
VEADGLGQAGRWRRVGLTLVVQSEVRPWRYPTNDFQYGDWLRGEFESGNVEPWPTRVNPDLATLIAMAVLANRPLLCAPAADLLDPIPSADLLEAATHAIESLRDDLASDTRCGCARCLRPAAVRLLARCGA